jgi:lysozyme family protein
MDEKFKCALERTLAFEGGYVNDPADPGGETKFGISARAHPGLDIKALTRDRAGEIYYEDYWIRYGYGRLTDAGIAAKSFDLAVNLGPHRAHVLLQETVNRTTLATLAVDGVLGPGTLDAVNGHPNTALLLAELKVGAIGYYTDLAIRKGMQKFLAGWIRRALA